MWQDVGPIPDVRKIAVLRANALGDYVESVPALEALREAYPNAEIVLLALDWHRRFLMGRLGLGGLAGLLARAAVVVANDMGPLHLARAVGAHGRHLLAFQLHHRRPDDPGAAPAGDLVARAVSGLRHPPRGDDLRAPRLVRG